MSTAFERAFDGLRSEGELSPSILRSLSDLDTASAEDLSRRWPTLSASRRLEAVSLAGRLADEHIELNFDRLNLIGVEDPDPLVRRQAVANLWESEDPSLASRFLALLQRDPEVAVQAEAARALGRFVLQMEETEADAAERSGLEEALLAASAHDDDQLRFPAIESLGFSSRAEVPGVIERLYASGGDDARRSALVAMGRSGDRRWRTTVEAELRSPSPGLRREAARAAGELELHSAVPELIELLEDVSLDVALQTIWALGQIGGKTAERALLRAQRVAADETSRLALQEALEHLTFLEGTRDLDAALRLRRESE